MYKALRFRLYSNTNRQQQTNKTLGCTRYVYSYYLSLKQKEYEEIKKNKSVTD